MRLLPRKCSSSKGTILCLKTYASAIERPGSASACGKYLRSSNFIQMDAEKIRVSNHVVSTLQKLDPSINYFQNIREPKFSDCGAQIRLRWAVNEGKSSSKCNIKDAQRFVRGVHRAEDVQFGRNREPPLGVRKIGFGRVQSVSPLVDSDQGQQLAEYLRKIERLISSIIKTTSCLRGAAAGTDCSGSASPMATRLSYQCRSLGGFVYRTVGA